MSEDKVVYRFIRVAHKGKSGWCSFPPGKEGRIRFNNGLCTYVAGVDEAKAIDEWIEKVQRPYGSQYILAETIAPIIRPTFAKISTDSAFKKVDQPALDETWIGFMDAVKYNAGKYEKGLGPKGLNNAVREGRVHRAEREDGVFYLSTDIARELDLKKGEKE